MTPVCYIDGCGRPAVLVLHTYPDRTRLCTEHRFLHDPEDWEPPAPVCQGDGCELCLDEDRYRSWVRRTHREVEL